MAGVPKKIKAEIIEAGAETIMSYGLEISRSAAQSLAEDVFRAMTDSKPYQRVEIKKTDAILRHWIELYRDETSMLLLQVSAISAEISDAKPL